jgi:hypothetical protein
MSRSLLNRTFCTTKDIRISTGILIGVILGIIFSLSSYLGLVFHTTGLGYTLVSSIGLFLYIIYISINCKAPDDSFRVILSLIGFLIPIIVGIVVNL